MFTERVPAHDVYAAEDADSEEENEEKLKKDDNPEDADLEDDNRAGAPKMALVLRRTIMLLLIFIKEQSCSTA